MKSSYRAGITVRVHGRVDDTALTALLTALRGRWSQYLVAREYRWPPGDGSRKSFDGLAAWDIFGSPKIRFLGIQC